MRATFASLARAQGHEVVEARSLDEVLAAYATEPPHLTVVDSRFPPDGAVPFVRTLLAREPAAKVVVLASLGEVSVLRVAVAAGAAGGMRRPLLPADVRSVVERLIASGASDGESP